MTTVTEQAGGPVAAPAQNVPVEWIDYNGHMNVAYYSLAFDQALDYVFEHRLGIGESHTRKTRQGPYVLQSHMHYIDEFLAGDMFTINLRLIDYDKNKIHVFLEMKNEAGNIAATSEQLLINVDLTTRRSTPYPEQVMQQFADMQVAHDRLPKPKQLATPIGIRKKG